MARTAFGYRTGRGRIYIRARTHIEDDESNGKQKIIATELPYQVNKARLVEKIADLVKEKKLEGITELRDESDKDGVRVVVELRRGENADVILNNLFQHTQLQITFGFNLVALVNGQPRLLNLKNLIEFFIHHRREVVTRRTRFELRKARDRAHILEGLAIILMRLWFSSKPRTILKKPKNVYCLSIGLLGRSSPCYRKPAPKLHAPTNCR